MRYDDAEYFWLNDLGTPFPKMVMHPTMPNLNGKILDDDQFNSATPLRVGTDSVLLATGGKKNLYVAFVDVVNQDGQGYVTYTWPKPKTGGGVTTEFYPKLSYVKKFAPWGWLIGSGIYIDDVNNAVQDKAERDLLLAAGVGALFLLFASVMARAITQAEEKFRAVSASAQDGIIVIDDEGCITYWNAAAEHIFGYSQNEVMGKELHPLLAPERFLPSHRQGFSQFRTTGEGAAVGKTLELAAVRKSGIEFPIELSLSTAKFDNRMHAIGIVRDITDRKQTVADLERLNRALRTISRCNEVLVHASNENDLLQEMCHTIVENGQYCLAWVGYKEFDDAKSVQPVARFGVDEGYLDHASITWANVERGLGPTGTAVRDGAVQVNHNFATNPQLGPWRDEALKRGFAASIALPLVDESRTYGALTIYASEPDAFDAQEVNLLMELANDLAFGISAARIRAERDRALKDLQLSAKVFDGSKEGILVTDGQRNILAVNQSFTTITGYVAEEVLGRNPNVIKSDRHDNSFFANMWASINQTGHWMGEIWNRRKNGEVFPVLQSISAIRDQAGLVTNYIGFFADITYSKESEERIRHLTQYDALTGLANRSLLVDRLEQAIVHAGRTGRLVAVIILDIDRIKLINDSLGHVAGDIVLKQVADRLSVYIRPGDTVARLGGDEFMLVMSDLAHENDAVNLARKLLDVVAAPMVVDEQSMVVTASFGMALFPKNGELAASLLKNADAAMHRAKELGRNSVQFYRAGNECANVRAA